MAGKEALSAVNESDHLDAHAQWVGFSQKGERIQPSAINSAND